LGDKATDSGSDVGDSDLNDEGGLDDEDVAIDEGLYSCTTDCAIDRKAN